MALIIVLMADRTDMLKKKENASSRIMTESFVYINLHPPSMNLSISYGN